MSLFQIEEDKHCYDWIVQEQFDFYKNTDSNNFQKQLKAVASISCMLGLGWMLGFFMTGPIAPYFQFVFIIVNGIQVGEL